MNEQLPHYFFAIPLPEEVRKWLSGYAETLKERMPYKVWPDRDDYHITLAFLGAAGFQKINEVKQAVMKTVEGQPTFSLKLNELGTFGNPKRPRVLWAGIKAHPELFELQKKVQSACESIGFQLDKRPYKPHITLAKKWAGAEAEVLDQKKIEIQLEALAWEVRGMVLYRIHLNQKPKYQPLKIFRF
ncbi:MAG TPA: RNA 2',3'-cyclic phosphodiesterase [Bacillales bacterium]|nr:RNA 2',3'-cyclic phosphodiesterase [Bacillales bacterium]